MKRCYSETYAIYIFFKLNACFYGSVSSSVEVSIFRSHQATGWKQDR